MLVFIIVTTRFVERDKIKRIVRWHRTVLKNRNAIVMKKKNLQKGDK